MAHGRFDNPVVAALHGIYDLFRKQDLEDRLTENDRLDGKRVVVTGANSGLGYAITIEMARRGGEVIMACRRDLPEILDKAKKESGSDTIEMRHLDLGDVESLYTFTNQLKAEGNQVDVLIMNAAVALPKSRKTELGLEEMFLVNYLANFMFVNLLTANHVLNIGVKEDPRVIFISSDSHQGSSEIDYSEFGNYVEYGVSKGIGYYSYYKLVTNTMMVELSRRINKESHKMGVNVICPGPVNTEIAKEAPPFLHKILKGIFRIMMAGPRSTSICSMRRGWTPNATNLRQEPSFGKSRSSFGRSWALRCRRWIIEDLRDYSEDLLNTSALFTQKSRSSSVSKPSGLINKKPRITFPV
jgi:NAD(P)-dependent dehydrogenase (short-subunit alcohol dehydrogenase family)